MSNGPQMLGTLRQHRPLLLACEAIGWLHMTGKAHPDFLRHHGGAGVAYDDLSWHERESPPFPWSDKLAWLKSGSWAIPSKEWPASLADFLEKHRRRDGGVLGLLQAAHGMASAIEKNVPTSTWRYLKQDVTHLWLSSPFGHFVRNLLADAPPLFQPGGWRELLQQIERLLDDLARLGSSPPSDPQPWWDWRERAIGPEGWLRQAFTSTLAETRLPNNDVTLWDQSYVAAALFKPAVAGAVLAGSSFKWDNQLKQQTRWRVLTVGFGTRHYEARAVKIGDWTGAQREIERFFEKLRCLIEVDLGVGSLVYRDDETLTFTFPGDRADGQGGVEEQTAEELRQAIAGEVDRLAGELKFETPPFCSLSNSTRSFVPMVKQLREARQELSIPLHRPWNIEEINSETASGERHVCPVCLVRFNEPPQSARTHNARKSYPCSVCRDRRLGRLDAWLAGGEDTIWISEVADDDDRVALLTLSFDLEPWLAGEHVDSLRAQSIAGWRRFNPVLEEFWKGDAQKRRRIDNPVPKHATFSSFLEIVERDLRDSLQQKGKLDVSNLFFCNLQEGYRYEAEQGADWKSYFATIVEDRSPDESVQWSDKDAGQNARWLAHQLFRKLPSPGRVYRFWRTAEAFFDELLACFREIASKHENRWRTRRLLLHPENGTAPGTWEGRETYTGHWRGAPFEVVYLADQAAFVTISNLARCFTPEEAGQALQQESQTSGIELKGDDQRKRKLRINSVSTPEKIGTYAPLIPLDLSPRRFRLLLPLDRATACIEAAIAKWRDEFVRVWDRMPLRVGVVAFPRLTSFQAVIEAARNLEDALYRHRPETWRLVECGTRDGVTALSLEHGHGREMVLVPTQLPDGRTDVFYPYVQVEDRDLRAPRDFQHPNGHVYRHMADLQPGDGLVVHPSRIATVFLDTTARRFDPPEVRPLGDFERMRAVWNLLARTSPSLSALRGVWSELEERARNWRDPEGRWLPGAEAEWLKLARAILRDRLGISGAALEALVEAARHGTLGWALEWHLTWLKENLRGVKA
jgi:CRISPR-associated Csx11 family protein